MFKELAQDVTISLVAVKATPASRIAHLCSISGLSDTMFGDLREPHFVGLGVRRNGIKVV